MRMSKDETVAKQDAFLVAFGEVGTVLSACAATGVPRSTYYGWIENNTYEFKAKKDVAWEIFREYLQDIALQRIKGQGPKDNPVLLMSYLNAFIPEYFKRDSSSTDSNAKEVMAELRRLRKLEQKFRDQIKRHGPSIDQRTAEELVEDEATEAKKKAMDEVEKILSRQRESDDDSE